MMNRIFKITGFLLFSGFIAACGNQQAEKSNDSDIEIEVSDHEHTDPHHSLAIELNDGDRWVVNDEMKPHVEKGEGILKSYIDTKNTDYKSLAVELDAANKNLISSCTMTGKSHDELHKWLHPHLELVKKLEAEENENHAKEIIADLETSYQNYHKHFK